MEKRLLQYVLIGAIFFIGLTVGISNDNDNTSDTSNKSTLQNQLDEFEIEIQTPNNDFETSNPYVDVDDITQDELSENLKVENNILNNIAKSGGSIIDGTIDFLSKSWDMITK